MKKNERVALITGANKGIGFEIARRLGKQGYTIALGARDSARGNAAVAKLAAEGIDARTVRVDVGDPATIASLRSEIEQRFGRLDVLVNNAGVLLDHATKPSTVDQDHLRATFDTNFFGPWSVTQALLPLLAKSPAGRIVNMSSTLGSLGVTSDASSPFDGFFAPSYQASKAALNMLTVQFAKELRGTKIKVNSACPGWVKTDMGTADAPLSVEQGADTPVWLATLPDDGPSGGFFNSREPVAW